LVDKDVMIWNYVVGVFMLMLGVVFFNFSKTFINPNSDSPFLEMLKILPVSLLIFLVIAWVVVRHNERPVVQISSE